MELTKEYFDKTIGIIFTEMSTLRLEMATKTDLAEVKADIEHMKSDIAGIKSVMVTKDDLKVELEDLSNELKDYVNQSFEVQQVWMDNRFDELIVKYDVRDRVLVLEKDVAQLKSKTK